MGLLLPMAACRERPAVVADQSPRPQTNAATADAVPGRNEEVNAPRIPAPASGEESSLPANEPPRRVDNDRLAAIVAHHNAPIDFYGMILDQDGQPLVGVPVQTAVWFRKLIPNTGVATLLETNTVVSDSAGKFSISGLEGFTLFIRNVEAEGYELDPKATPGFTYGPTQPINHVPEPDRPVVFRMWKRGVGVELVRQSFRTNIRADGSDHYFNWVTGEVSDQPGTNRTSFLIRVRRDPLLFKYSESFPQTWSYEVAIPQGGLQYTADPFLYRAPESGYEPSVGRQFRSGQPGYAFRDHPKLFFRSAEGRYGNATLEVWADRDGENALIWMHTAYNPDGTRNLEPARP